MWSNLWPWRVEEEIPIGHISNGVHVPSWLAWQMLQLYDRNFPVGWLQRMGERFATVKPWKPEGSRPSSPELYLVGKGFAPG